MRWTLLLALLVAACDDGGGGSSAPCADPAPALAGDDGLQKCVFQPTCALAASCHGPRTPQLGLSFTSEAATCAGLVGHDSEQVPGRKRVAAGHPDASYLIDKLTGAHGIVGTPMPPPEGGLPDASVDAVRAWIAAGAPCD